MTFTFHHPNHYKKLKKKQKLSEKYIMVGEKNKPYREIKNPDYNPDKRRKTQPTLPGFEDLPEDKT